jgi:drug/metabolite transporter (DMT)-like permease
LAVGLLAQHQHAAAFAFVVLREQVTPIQLIGGALIIAGVYLLRQSEKPAFVP